eukprot:12268893-Karenia_brevis.AAC.1
MGSDHRAVSMKLRVGDRVRKRWKKGKTFEKGLGTGWRPVESELYVQTLEEKLAAERTILHLEIASNSIDVKLERLERAIIETAEICKAVDKNIDASKFEVDAETLSLMKRRKAMSSRSGDQELRRELSKQISSNLRKRLRAHKRSLINQRLQEFRNLKAIANVRCNGKKYLLGSVFDSSG